MNILLLKYVSISVNRTNEIPVPKNAILKYIQRFKLSERVSYLCFYLQSSSKIWHILKHSTTVKYNSGSLAFVFTFLKIKLNCLLYT